jgi:hypothetical protein
MINKRIRSIFNRFIINFAHPFTSVNKDAIWIFGMPKSGTTAIAALLGHMGSKSITLDTKYLWDPYLSKILSGKYDLNRHFKRYSYPFSKDIIKEPVATEFIDLLKNHYSLNKYVFIVRNPHDNIRSILNRMKIPGDLQDINLSDVSPGWRRDLGPNKGKDYISALANMWVRYNTQWNYVLSPKCSVIKYEDFQTDKVKAIENLCCSLDLPILNNIDHLIHKPFQPKGDSLVDLKLFFGDENHKLISDICLEGMSYYRYV